jgi:hypothetical protein
LFRVLVVRGGTSSACTHKFAMSALLPKADIHRPMLDVRFVPKADIGLLTHR